MSIFFKHSKPKTLLNLKVKYLLLSLTLMLICFNCNTKTKKVVINEGKETFSKAAPSINGVDLSITKNFVLGKFNYKNDTTFVKVKSHHSAKLIYLKNEVYAAFLKMEEAAFNDGITFNIISGTRNFFEQKAIWERKWKMYQTLAPIDRAKKILEYSSMPSSSRHHWGTDIDLNSLNNSYFNSGKGLNEYQWLITYANHYGFYQVYTTKANGRNGYNEEKWHWSYLPLACKYLEFYNFNISNKDITKFKGAELSDSLSIVENYVNGISVKAKTYKQ